MVWLRVTWWVMLDLRDLPTPSQSDAQSGRDRMILGASILGAFVAVGGAFWLLDSASRFDGFPVRVIASLDPSDRTLLKSLTRSVQVTGGDMRASLDKIVDRGINV